MVNKRILMFFTLVLSFLFLSCKSKVEITIISDITIEIGETIDFEKYIIITKNDINVKVKDSYLDLSSFDSEKTGTYKVTVSFESEKKDLTIIVKPKSDNNPIDVQSITITNKISNMNVGVTYTLNVEVLPSTVTKGYNITSSDESIIKVENNVITALKEGTCEIIASIDGKEDRIVITVTENKKLSDDIITALKELNSYNYKVNYNLFIPEYSVDSVMFYECYYDGDNICYKYLIDNKEYCDYIIKENDLLYYYRDDNGAYTVFNEKDDSFNDAFPYNVYLVFSNIESFISEGKDSNEYILKNPQETYNLIFGENEGKYEVTSIKLLLDNNHISLIGCEMNYYDENTNSYVTYYEEYEFSMYGECRVDKDLINNTSDYYDVNSSLNNNFTDQNLSSDNSIEFFSDKKSNAFDNIRGVQFLQKNGDVLISSKTLFSNVKTISLTLSTNSLNGMRVKVSVGDVFLKSDEGNEYTVSKLNFNEVTQVIFKSSSSLSGELKIYLLSNDDSKSMYIKSIDFNQTEESLYMGKQIYDKDNFDSKKYQDYYYETYGTSCLPSSGDYNILVIPVEFKGERPFTSEMLNMLDLAFNGSEEETGWHSVSSFYRQSSFNKLNITFDIVDPYKASNDSKYYGEYQEKVLYEDGTSDIQNGCDVIYIEALTYVEEIIDLTKYDYNKDNTIDGVCIIYNTPVDYDNDDTIYWAITYQSVISEDELMFDGLGSYFYCFMGYDFIFEDVSKDMYGIRKDLVVNATTYIHEMGHMLGLDDYYDYDTSIGCNEGLGGADMMDGCFGDHCSYSKIMLDWLNPTIVTEDIVVTVKPYEDVILIPLDFNNSFMSEYLLIDMYSQLGINSLYSEYLFGDDPGVRIYHVSSSLPEDSIDDYSIITKYNNTGTDIALIKLIEADKEIKFKSGEGYSEDDDLFRSGMKLSDAFTNYKRNDGKIINFDVIIESVESDKAVIKVDFIDAE